MISQVFISDNIYKWTLDLGWIFNHIFMVKKIFEVLFPLHRKSINIYVISPFFKAWFFQVAVENDWNYVQFYSMDTNKWEQ